MKTPNLKKLLLATSLSLAFASTLVGEARAELVSQEVSEDAITPEHSASPDDEVIIVKKKKPSAPVATRRVIVREEAAPVETTSALEAAPVAAQPVALSAPSQTITAPVVTAQATATATAAAPALAQPKSMGTTLDEGVNRKMDDVRAQFEGALVRTLDRIKINVDDGSAPAAPAAEATATATAIAAPAPAPVPTVVVKDSVVNATAAPANYMPVEKVVAADEDEEGGTSVAKKSDGEEESFVGRFRIAPVVGVNSISSDFYDIKSRYAAGINLEMEVAENFAVYLGYTYSQSDIGLGAGLGGFGNPYAYGSNFGYGGYNTLQYNQNTFEIGGRFYLMPRESVFRVYLGAGVGLDKGYVNYRNQNFGGGFSPYYNLQDYELTSYLGILSTGAEVRVSHNVAVGADFKYATVLSAKQNANLYNYGFYGNYGGGAGITQEQALAGSTLANQSSYSILGTVKVGF